jgi:hypothetical protein
MSVLVKWNGASVPRCFNRFLENYLVNTAIQVWYGTYVGAIPYQYVSVSGHDFVSTVFN